MPDINEDMVKQKEEKGKNNKSAKTEFRSAPTQNEDDEFDGEVVVMDVKRQESFPEWLENLKPEPEKVGVPIEDILEIPTLQKEQESAPEDELFIEEKIEAVECPQGVFCELPDCDVLEKM